MPTKKIADLPKYTSEWHGIKERCRDREHNPPSMVVYEPGVYEHTCSSCGNKQTFVVAEGPTL